MTQQQTTVHDFHFFVGDGNDGTSYQHTVKNLTLDEAVRHASRHFCKAKYRGQLTADGDAGHFSLELCDEGALNGGSSLIIDLYSRDGEVREPIYSEHVHELTKAERGRLKF